MTLDGLEWSYLYLHCGKEPPNWGFRHAVLEFRSLASLFLRRKSWGKHLSYVACTFY